MLKSLLISLFNKNEHPFGIKLNKKNIKTYITSYNPSSLMYYVAPPQPHPDFPFVWIKHNKKFGTYLIMAESYPYNPNEKELAISKINELVVAMRQKYKHHNYNETLNVDNNQFIYTFKLKNPTAQHINNVKSIEIKLNKTTHGSYTITLKYYSLNHNHAENYDQYIKHKVL